MRKCKKDGCRKLALLHGKQYCEEHMAAYKRKRKEAEARHASLADCRMEDCREKVCHGSDLCRSHFDKQQNERQAEYERDCFRDQTIAEQIMQLYDMMKGNQ